MDERILATPVVAIIGRTNVGKSTLFNRLIERRKAIMSPIPGTTTDINFGHCHWQGKTLTVVDTAGLDLTTRSATGEDLKRQAQLAMAKSDVILFIVDARDGMLAGDRALAGHLRKSKKRILLATNKADNPRVRHEIAGSPEWEKLGFGPPLPISAANGTGVGDMLDRLLEILHEEGKDDLPLPEIDLRVAIVGKPNVGKSSLLNSLAGEDRVIVSEVPHTTKEPQDTLLTVADPKRGTKHILLIDTVGIRKKARMQPGIESLGVAMSLSEVERADIVFVMADAVEGVGVQEKKLAGIVEEKSPGILVVVNKWDIAEERGVRSADDFRSYIAAQLPFCTWAPVVFISAKTGRGVQKLLEAALTIAEERDRTISSEELDRFATKLKKIHHSAFKRGEKRPVVYGISQIGTQPPSFMVVVKDKETIHPNFLRFIENRLREEFGFVGTALRVLAREIDA